MLDAGQLIRRRRFLGSSLPYTASPDLFAWDFRSGGGRVLDASGSLESVPEMSRGTAHAMRQLTVTNQPSADANGAIFPIGGTASITTSAAGGPLLNSAVGGYFASLMQIDPAAATGSRPLVFKTASGGAGRMYTHLDWARRLNIFGKPNDVATVLYGQAPPVSYGVWTLLEVELLLGAGGHIKVWYNGVPQAISSPNPTSFTAFPSSDSAGIVIPSSTGGSIALIGASNGVLPASVRQSFSDYGNSVRLILP